MEIIRNDTVFFFGAGASAVEGAPIASKLLTDAFNEFPSDGRVQNIKNFLQDFYTNDCSNEKNIPTFEEILSPIDICLQKQEQFSQKWNTKTLKKLRDDLIYCICKILNEKLYTNNIHHKKMIASIFNNPGTWNRFSFISLNYDILIDNALLTLGYEEGVNDDSYVDLDYGVDFRNTGSNRDCWRAPKERKTYLLKLHGSLNWLFCPTCNSIKITPKQKGVMRIFSDSEICEHDQTNQKALIIPPTWQKVYDNPYLVSIWLNAEQKLRRARKIIFIGYSMPDSDVHIKYLMKKSLYAEQGTKPEIIVVDKEGKGEESEEYIRYKRLFGEITYLPIGFENFAENVSSYI